LSFFTSIVSVRPVGSTTSPRHHRHLRTEGRLQFLKAVEHRDIVLRQVDAVGGDDRQAHKRRLGRHGVHHLAVVVAHAIGQHGLVVARLHPPLGHRHRTARRRGDHRRRHVPVEPLAEHLHQARRILGVDIRVFQVRLGELGIGGQRLVAYARGDQAGHLGRDRHLAAVHHHRRLGRRAGRIGERNGEASHHVLRVAQDAEIGPVDGKLLFGGVEVFAPERRRLGRQDKLVLKAHRDGAFKLLPRQPARALIHRRVRDHVRRCHQRLGELGLVVALAKLIRPVVGAVDDVHAALLGLGEPEIARLGVGDQRRRLLFELQAALVGHAAHAVEIGRAAVFVADLDRAGRP
jgi:hypothetical protein